MLTHSIRPITLSLFCLLLFASLFQTSTPVSAKKRRAPAGGRLAVVVDERLAVVREAPGLQSALVQRLGRGRMVSLVGAKSTKDGLVFYRVAVTSRTRGWLQSEAFASPARANDDARLHRLILGSESFDLIERARIFLDLFPKSQWRPAVLALYGEAAENAAERLSREAARRLDEREMKAGGAPEYSYFMSYSGLDRYRRQGVQFIFDRASREFHYDGESWREILRRYPHSPEAPEARKRLDSLSIIVPK